MLQAPARMPPGRPGRDFLRRYALDTLGGSSASRACAGEDEADVLHGDARELDAGGPFDAVVTSPPYPGRIDYHEQHRYAYELLDSTTREEIGAAEPARAGRRSGLRRRHSRGACQCGEAFGPVRRSSSIDDRRGSTGDPRARGLRLGRFRRHVNRRTGRRAGEYFEDVLVARA